MKVVLRIPQRLDAAHALRFVAGLEPVHDAEEYFADFGRVGHFSPFGMLVTAAGLKAFRQTLPKVRFRLLNHEGQTYASHMGLFQAIGAAFGNEPGEAAGGPRYVPITKISSDEIRREAVHFNEGFNEIVHERANRLARLLLQRDEGSAVEMITYSIREVMRNVFEHSESDCVWYAGQYWPSSGHVEVAILDEGIGIRNSLKPNPHLDIDSDGDALKMSMLPGVSGKVFVGRRASPNDEWANSGYGLFMTSGLCRRGGRFVIASGSCAVFARGDTHRVVSTNIQGTALCLRLALSNDLDFDMEMRDLRNAGESIARLLRGAVVTPSAASSYLKRPRAD